MKKLIYSTGESHTSQWELDYLTHCKELGVEDIATALSASQFDQGLGNITAKQSAQDYCQGLPEMKMVNVKRDMMDALHFFKTYVVDSTDNFSDLNVIYEILFRMQDELMDRQREAEYYDHGVEYV